MVIKALRGRLTVRASIVRMILSVKAAMDSASDIFKIVVLNGAR